MIELLTSGVDWTLQVAQHGTHGTGMSGLGWFWAPLVIGLIGVLLAGILYATSTQDEPTAERTDSLGLLRQRYARGEIDHEEFESRRSRLEQRD